MAGRQVQYLILKADRLPFRIEVLKRRDIRIEIRKRKKNATRIQMGLLTVKIIRTVTA